MAGTLVVCEHLAGKFSDITFEMLDLANSLGTGEINALTFGSMAENAGELGIANKVISASCSDDFNSFFVLDCEVESAADFDEGWNDIFDSNLDEFCNPIAFEASIYNRVRV